MQHIYAIRNNEGTMNSKESRKAYVGGCGWRKEKEEI